MCAEVVALSFDDHDDDSAEMLLRAGWLAVPSTAPHKGGADDDGPISLSSLCWLAGTEMKDVQYYAVIVHSSNLAIPRDTLMCATISPHIGTNGSLVSL